MALTLDTYDQRAAVVGATVVTVQGRTVTITLDGHTAEIMGSKLDYPLVVAVVPNTLNLHGTRSVQYSWRTVAHVLSRPDNPGAFES